ncbi:hypothetical protein SAMN04487930_11171 [Cytophaga hutchinsonii ATCC 33406]|nr:hypothetical protein SAMN04487930_11171 [Cytophaga hutchinsonii ATCC 33406]
MLYVLSTFVVVSQTLNNIQIKDSITAAYSKMNEFHLTVYSKTDMKGKEQFNFTYQLYKKYNEFYVKYTNMEVIFNTDMVLMVVPDQKNFVIRPVTEKESKKMQEIVIPKLSDKLDTIRYDFYETAKQYTTSILNPSNDIAEMKFYYNKTTFLLDKVEYAYTNTQERENQKTLITYTYEKLPVGINYFNTDKYIIKTAKGYVPAAAYSSYSISLNDPYEN